MSKCKLILLCCSLAVNAFSQNTSQLNLDSCHVKAEKNYPLIKQYDLISKSLDYTISNANKAYLPHVSVTAIAGYILGGLPTITIPGQPAPSENKGQMIGIGQINQVIWDGGATRAYKEIAKAGAEVDKAGIEVAMFNIRERVNQLYFGILVIDEQVKQLNIAKDNLNRNLSRVKLSRENGLAYQPDVDEVKAEVLNIEQKIIEFNFARKGYVEMLSYMTGEPLQETVSLEKPMMAETYTSLTNNRPELKLYANQMKLVEATSSIDKANIMPKIGLLGAGVMIQPGISFGAEKMNSLAVVGLSASWNTAGLYRSANNKQLNRIKEEKIMNQQETFTFTNNLQLKQAASEIEKHKAILAKDDEIVSLKGNIKNGYQVKYDNGMCTMNDVINAINKESEATGNQALHTVQLLMSLYNYKTISGN